MSARWLRPLGELGLLRELQARLQRGEAAPVAGPIGSARLLIPLLATPAPLLVIVPRERELEGAALDLSTWVRELGQPGSVLPFPAPGPAPFRGLPRHPDASLKRAAALHAARRGRARALVASPAGLLRPTLQPELFETRAFSLRAGEEMTPEILLEALDECGYVRSDPVSGPGEMAQRGGIVDVYPPDRDAPLRVEFLGDTMESLRAFDPDTQRSQAGGACDEVELVPLSDAFAPRSLLLRLRQRLQERFAGHRELPGLIDKLERGFAPELLPELLPLVAGATLAPWQTLPGFALVALEPEAIRSEAEALWARAREDRAARGDELLPDVSEALLPLEALGERLERGPAIH